MHDVEVVLQSCLHGSPFGPPWHRLVQLFAAEMQSALHLADTAAHGLLGSHAIAPSAGVFASTTFASSAGVFASTTAPSAVRPASVPTTRDSLPTIKEQAHIGSATNVIRSKMYRQSKTSYECPPA